MLDRMWDRIGTEMRAQYEKAGGKTAFLNNYINEVTDLHRIYEEIQNELRSQYILSFYPPEDVKTGAKWRNVTVEVANAKAKTIRGYYP